MELLSRLLPQAPLLRLETWQIDTASAQVTLRVQSTQTRGHCPVCRCPTRRIHSRYTRTVADLPWAHCRVVWQLCVRKFFCTNGRCTRRIFTERLPGVVAPWARRTERLFQWLTHIALALGGAAGVRLSRCLGVAISRRTLLRVLRRLPIPSFASPTVLGVDDFAMRTRQRYSTVLIDLERRQPVALLPDRTAETLAHWLREHPGVGVIARDRSKAYADGAHQGAPTAVQVADRFHLLQNLAEALDQVFTTHSQTLDAVNAVLRQQPGPVSDGAVAVPVPSTDSPTPAQQRAAQRQARRQSAYEQVWALHRQGWTVAAIAQQVGISPRTVQRDLQTATFLGRQRRSDRGRSLLNPYKAVLIERWNAGCHTALQLFRDLQRRGYAGSYGLVAAYARGLRQAQGLAPGQRRVRQPLPVVAESPYQPLTPRRATWLVLRRAEQRTAAEAEQLAHLRAQQADVAEAIDLAQDFAALVRQRQPERLDPWLKRATTSALQAVQRFAKGLYQDYDAVKAGVTLPWSTGPVEGHINRLKMLKRQMFGRARLDLLGRRFVRTPAYEQERSQPGAVAASSRGSNRAWRDTTPDVLEGRRGVRLDMGRRWPDRLMEPLAF
jgi:transposase